MKLRHGPRLISGRITPLSPTADGKTRLRVQMDESDRGIAPGQFAVFYDDELCLGGAMIDESGGRLRAYLIEGLGGFYSVIRRIFAL